MGKRPTRSRSSRRAPRLLAALSALTASVALAACGGDDAQRQDAGEPAGEFPLEVTEARFPSGQRLAQTSDLRLEVANAGRETIPDLAVTIWLDEGADGPFSVRLDQPDLADPNRPAWILESGFPKVLPPDRKLSSRQIGKLPDAGADAAQTNTFSFGPLAPGRSRAMVWRVTPVMTGTYRVNYELAAGLAGKARTVAPDGGPVRGRFPVEVTDRPPRTRVDDAGKVEILD